MAAKKKKEIGKGIRALLNNIENEDAESQEQIVSELSSQIAMLPLEQIEVNPWQPRLDFDETALKELAASIKAHGLIQPITVRRLTADRYQLISGGRRLKASKIAELEEVPAFIRLANDQEMLEMALIENIQREQLNPHEIALTYQRLIEEFSLTHEQMSERVGKSRSTITNFLSLLKLPPDIQKSLKQGELSVGHGKVLVGIKDFAIQKIVFNQILEKELSVRETEKLAASYTTKKVAAKSPKANLPEEYKAVQDNLRSYLGSRVNLKLGKNGTGQININFTSVEDLNRILDLIED